MRRVLLVGIAVVAGAAGCGGTAQEPAAERADDPGEVRIEESALLSAAAASLDADSARMSITMTMRAPVPGFPGFSVKADGVVDLVSGDMSLLADYGALAEQAPPGEDLPFDRDDLVVEVRSVDGVMYMQMGFLFGAAGVDAEWVALDLEEMLDEFGFDGELFGQLQPPSDPTAMLEFLGAAADVEEVGRDVVRGVSTTRYHATLDLVRLLEEGVDRLPPDLRERFEREGGVEGALGAFAEMFEGVDVETDVWVGDDDLVRRLRMVMPLDELGDQFGAPPGELAGLEIATTMDVYDYGVEVDVQAPPPEDVVGFDEIEELLGGAGLAA
jgi:hypothetical protein